MSRMTSITDPALPAFAPQRNSAAGRLQRPSFHGGTGSRIPLPPAVGQANFPIAPLDYPYMAPADEERLVTPLMERVALANSERKISGSILMTWHYASKACAVHGIQVWHRGCWRRASVGVDHRLLLASYQAVIPVLRMAALDDLRLGVADSRPLWRSLRPGSSVATERPGRRRHVKRRYCSGSAGNLRQVGDTVTARSARGGRRRGRRRRHPAARRRCPGRCNFLRPCSSRRKLGGMPPLPAM